MNHDRPFSWQAQYLLKLEGTSDTPHNVNHVSCIAAIKHECHSSLAFCIAEVAPRNVLDVSCAATIKRTTV